MRHTKLRKARQSASSTCPARTAGNWTPRCCPTLPSTFQLHNYGSLSQQHSHGWRKTCLRCTIGTCLLPWRPSRLNTCPCRTVCSHSLYCSLVVPHICPPNSQCKRLPLWPQASSSIDWRGSRISHANSRVSSSPSSCFRSDWCDSPK